MAAESPDDSDASGEKRPASESRDHGTLSVVGIGPGLPHAMTQEAKDVIRTADCVIASNLYQEFLRKDGTLPPESAAIEAAADGGADSESGTVLERPNGTRQELVRSSMGRQIELAREAFERVRAGEDVAHVSGGDPNVYGKSDLLYTMAEAEGATDVPIEVVPGVTAALGGAANLGAPLSNDFCTISLSDKWRGWDEIEEKLRAAAISGFVVVLYNCWRDYERAIDVLREERADDVPVGIFNDAGRGEAGRNLEDETHTITTLGAATDHDDEVGGMGTSILVGNHETEVWENDYGKHLVTPRGGRDVDDF
ncbi:MULTISPECIES: precorrin-3B C(17)-methyltransferase [Halomicrobium]|uniref:Uroporphyrin-III C/tetrapyrrole (Corrin/Porphyrin) methyltransferase n=2 Tax=Halomicrobium mukohataei TaxID=57705 RepID=C7P4G2_HALMD|nr:MULTISPECIES: SAM-dependent methyltransferase [Halomicrobium]ACV47984.1 Uroporphyrin-III C/tetrapyrrole (Corrin/Porphyrin) methyltransferase [Halomicrobium mukohataei DSM 12286]QCD66421.1 cobalt-precorrin-2 C(20)-methyltransferase [Halomicrobium mukohataei]QFR21226.1 cobalt-precorrin-2 C(20)-methyltransferase [Halomicrobium sp. ZPS1]